MSSIGRDDVLKFGPGQYVEVSDDQRELRGEAGILVKLANAEGQVLTLDTTRRRCRLVWTKLSFPDQMLATRKRGGGMGGWKTLPQAYGLTWKTASRSSSSRGNTTSVTTG